MTAVTKLRPEPAEQPSPLAKLREPFAPNQISKLPKPYKKDSPKGKCAECGGYHGLPAAHLDYVGHAALTDRLLDTDPHWTWEPVGDPASHGLPVAAGGMWIKLTVCGVSRLGYGFTPAKQNQDPGDAIKETIGDALRNAAMRFGAALDLWHKGDLHVSDDEPDKPAPRTVAKGAEAPATPTLAERAARLEAAMRAQKTEADLRKAYALASGLCAQLDDKDPERLAEIEQLYGDLLNQFAAPVDDFGIGADEIPF